MERYSIKILGKVSFDSEMCQSMFCGCFRLPACGMSKWRNGFGFWRIMSRVVSFYLGDFKKFPRRWQRQCISIIETIFRGTVKDNNIHVSADHTRDIRPTKRWEMAKFGSSKVSLTLASTFSPISTSKLQIVFICFHVFVSKTSRFCFDESPANKIQNMVRFSPLLYRIFHRLLINHSSRPRQRAPVIYQNFSPAERVEKSSFNLRQFQLLLIPHLAFFPRFSTKPNPFRWRAIIENKSSPIACSEKNAHINH